MHRWGRRWILVCGTRRVRNRSQQGLSLCKIFLHQSKPSEQSHWHRPNQEMLTFHILGLLSCNNRGLDLYTLTQRSSQGFRTSEKSTSLWLLKICWWWSCVSSSILQLFSPPFPSSLICTHTQHWHTLSAHALTLLKRHHEVGICIFLWNVCCLPFSSHTHVSLSLRINQNSFGPLSSIPVVLLLVA